MRRPRAKADGEGFYHIVNRLSWQGCFLKGDWKKRLLEHIRSAAEFAGVEILTFAIMGNHFHLLARVEARKEVSDDELVERMGHIYSEKQLEKKQNEWKHWDADEKTKWKADEARARMRARMYDLSEFVKIFAQRFSMEYNAARKYTGSPWGQRFKSILIERGSRTLPVVGAYIDLNPIRARIFANTGEYQWTGLGAALRGDESAREGLISLVAYAYGIERRDWDETLEIYRSILDGRLKLDAAKNGDTPRKNGVCPPTLKFDEREVSKKIKEGKMLTLFELLRCEVRNFSNGWALGSDGFAKSALLSAKGGQTPKRGIYAIRCGELAGIGTARKVRNSDAVELPESRSYE